MEITRPHVGQSSNTKAAVTRNVIIVVVAVALPILNRLSATGADIQAGIRIGRSGPWLAWRDRHALLSRSCCALCHEVGRMINLLRASCLALALAPASAKAEHWTAVSTTAMGVTGDLAISPGRVVLSGHVFRTGPATKVHGFIAYLEPPPVDAEIRPVISPTNPRLLRGNHLCSAPTRWIVTWRTADGGLGLSAFTGRAKPHDVRSADSCGTYTYGRLPEAS